MADNVVRFRRPEKKPEPPKRPGGQGPGGRKPDRPAMSQSRLSLVAWLAIIGLAVLIVAGQQSGFFGG